MEFRTKREAEEAAQRHDEMADRATEAAILYDAGSKVASRRRSLATTHRAEAARIRALLPTLPEE